jgi:hypothetical protein
MSTALDAWFESLPGGWQGRALRIRHLLLDTAPDMREESKYGIPFYSRKRWMCYLSIQQGALVLGFIQGAFLVDPEDLFADTEHKLIRHYRVPPPEAPMDEEALQRLIVEAAELNLTDIGRSTRASRKAR